jgi:hypothetical protein
MNKIEIKNVEKSSDKLVEVNGIYIGYLSQEIDGIYYLNIINSRGVWSGECLAQIAKKIIELNTN